MVEDVHIKAEEPAGATLILSESPDHLVQIDIFEREGQAVYVVISSPAAVRLGKALIKAANALDSRKKRRKS